MILLVGDLGGTNLRLGLVQDGDLVTQRTEACAGHASISNALSAFLSEVSVSPDAGCLAVAGPVRQGRVTMTNLGWTLHEGTIAKAVGCPLRLVNDFEAQAQALPHLEEGDWAPLVPGEPEPGAPLAVLGAGTGLGEGILLSEPGGRWRAVPGEGGHGRFAPRDERDVAILRALWRRWPQHVSVERVVSGPGLVNVYHAVRGEAPAHPDMELDDAPETVVRLGLSEACPHAVGALEVFAGAYGDEAATLALKCNAGVVYLTGGVTPHVLPALRTHFVPAFVAKGRYGPWLQQVPVRAVVHPDPGLVGAAVVAASLLGASGSEPGLPT